MPLKLTFSEIKLSERQGYNIIVNIWDDRKKRTQIPLAITMHDVNEYNKYQ